MPDFKMKREIRKLENKLSTRETVLESQSIKRVSVWSRNLRVSHWLMTLSVLVLIATSWFIGAAPGVSSVARDYHYYAGVLLFVALLLRIYLLFFGKGTDNISDLEPDKTRLSAAIGVLKFYLTLGRTPLPAWYAHNPLWGPVYLLLFLFLGLQVFSGLAQQHYQLLGAVNLRDLHIVGAKFVNGFVLLHLVAVFMHDLYGKGSDISAMVSGQRIFVIEKTSAGSSAGEYQAVSLDELKNSLSKRGK